MTSYEYAEGAALAAFAADLRAVIARAEGGAIPNRMRRQMADAAPIGEEPAPAEEEPDGPAFPTIRPLAVPSLKERLKARRAAS